MRATSAWLLAFGRRTSLTLTGISCRGGPCFREHEVPKYFARLLGGRLGRVCRPDGASAHVTWGFKTTPFLGGLVVIKYFPRA